MPLSIRSMPLTKPTTSTSSLNSQGTTVSTSDLPIPSSDTISQVGDVATKVIESSPEGMAAQAIAGDAAKSKTGLVLTGIAIYAMFRFRRKLLRG